MPPFIVYALPRSRTAWLASFLSYRDWTCGHEEALHARSVDDVKAWFSQPNTGTAETLGATWWRTVQAVAPSARVVTIRRPVADVVASLMRTGLFPDAALLHSQMAKADRKLDQVERRVPGVLSIPFADLAQEATCARVFEHCLPHAHDPAWWAHLDAQNIQINLLAMVRRYQAFQPALAKVAAQLRWATIDGFARKPAAEMDELTIQEEGFDTFYRDSKSAFREHLVATGQHPEAYLDKNTDLMRSLERLGGLQVITARSNGRVFGYLMTVYGPSLDSPDVIEGQHTLTFASSEFPGLGMKIQRVARDALRAKGINDLIFRAGIRGSGPRLGSLYRRLGAEPFGELYRLQL